MKLSTRRDEFATAKRQEQRLADSILLDCVIYAMLATGNRFVASGRRLQQRDRLDLMFWRR